MDAIDHIRDEIKAYFPGSSELQLSEAYARHRRYNFYFQLPAGGPHLFYLNWDGEDSVAFTLKCLSFPSAEILKELIDAYPIDGSKTFNLGKPKASVSFVYRAENKLFVFDFKDSNDPDIRYNELSGKRLIECVDPNFS